MHGRARRVAAAGVVAVSLAGAMVVTGDRVARACSCAASRPVDLLAIAEVVVRGEAIDRRIETIDGSEQIVWQFRVDERFRGATAPVIEVQADAFETSCGEPLDAIDGTLRLDARKPSGRWSVDRGCSSPVVDPQTVEFYFDGPPAVNARGPPVAVLAVDAAGHDLVVVDAAGLPLRYLPGDGPTLAVAECPGGERFVQMRVPTRELDVEQPLELVVWNTLD